MRTTPCAAAGGGANSCILVGPKRFFFFTYPLFFRYMWGNLSERDNSMWFQVIGIRSYGASNNVILCRSLRGIVFVLLCGKVRMEDKPQHNILV